MSDQLRILFDAVAKGLLKRIDGTDATASDYTNAIRFLKDNGIDCDVEENEDLQALVAKAPTFKDEEYEDVEEETRNPFI